MAVYTHIEKETLEDFLSGFDIGALLSFEGIAEGVENSNYLVTTNKNKYILTLIEKRTNPEDLPFYIAFVEHLRESGIPCPEIVADTGGKKIFFLEGKSAIVTEFLEGAWPREISAAHCAAVGTLLGNMHLAGKTFGIKRKNSMAPPAWTSLIHASADKADTIEKGLIPFLETELTHLGKNWPKLLPKGGVHADLFPDNVFFSGDRVSGVIDFYFSCWETLAYDLMLTMNPWCFDKNGSLDKEKSAALLSAYHKTRPLSRNEIRSLPFFGRAAAVRIIATRLYDSLNPPANALVKPKDPMEHVKILRFHQQVSSVADYGLTL